MQYLHFLSFYYFHAIFNVYKQLFCILSTRYLYFKTGIKTIETSLYVAPALATSAPRPPATPSRLQMSTGNSPSGSASPSPSPWGKKFPIPVPVKCHGGDFLPIPIPRGELVPVGIPMGRKYFIVIYKVCTSNFI